VSQDYALDRVRARRRPPQPPGKPPIYPWWLSAAMALMLGYFGVRRALEPNWFWMAWDGFFAAANGHYAVRRWQWDRYNRWRGGGS
jgi:hypothetical protein